jgi:hypothetical protein
VHNAVTRIWDSFLWEGWKVVYRVSLSVLKASEAELLACSNFEEIMTAFRAIVPQKAQDQPDKILADAFGWTFSRNDIAHLESEYKELQAAGLETCTVDAGRGVKHIRKVQEAAKAAAAKGRGGKT